MGRPVSRGFLENLIWRIREEVPGVCLRTTLLVGFPGETAAQFSELFEFVEKVRFDRLGVFEYSREEGTRAARMRNRIPRHVKKRRFKRLMELQQRISLEHNRGLIGEKVVVLIEERLEDATFKGRMATQAPDVDGHVTIAGGRAQPGEMVDVLITKAHPYDLEGEIV
jgi:ribosomal protein S12 methylthiotransferase